MRKDAPPRSLRRHGGAAVVEFAFIFPVLFMLSYGAVVYSYAYVLKQSLTFAAQEAAEAAVDIDPHNNSGYKSQLTAAATTTATAVVAWMPDKLRTGMGTSVRLCSDGGLGTACPSGGGDAVVVQLTLPLTGKSALFAQMKLPFVGNFPPLPATMTAQATARV